MWDRNNNCLFMNKTTGKLFDLSCSKESSFFCEVEATRVRGNETFVLNSTNMAYGTFNLWWTNNPKLNESKSPGIRISWHLNEPSMHGDMKASAIGVSGQISTPGFGAGIRLDQKQMTQTYSASVGLPTNITDVIGDGSLVVDIDVENPETGRVGSLKIHKNN